MAKGKKKKGKKKPVTQIFSTAHYGNSLGFFPNCNQQNPLAPRELLNGSYEYDMGRSPWHIESHQTTACKLHGRDQLQENLQRGPHASWTLRQIENPHVRTASCRPVEGVSTNDYLLEVSHTQLQINYTT